jgi:hypothetical protein
MKENIELGKEAKKGTILEKRDKGKGMSVSSKKRKKRRGRKSVFPI